MEPQTLVIKLRIVRHGETTHNRTRTMAGQQPGQLTQLGSKQAQMIGAYFHHHKTPFDIIYVSDLGRTKQTFQNAAMKAPHLKSIETKFIDLIRERKAGVLENKPLGMWESNAKKEGKDIREYKCEGGQSWMDVMDRAKKFVQMLVVQHCIKQQKTLKKVLAVSHGGFIMQLHNTCNRISGKPIKFANTAKNCSMHEFEIQYPKDMKQFDQKQVKIKCTQQNFVGHLKN